MPPLHENRGEDRTHRVVGLRQVEGPGAEADENCPVGRDAHQRGAVLLRHDEAAVGERAGEALRVRPARIGAHPVPALRVVLVLWPPKRGVQKLFRASGGPRRGGREGQRNGAVHLHCALSVPAGLQTKPHHARREVWERKKSHAVIPGALGLERSRVRQAEEAAAALEAPLVACEKESEVRSENDSEEEETYLPRNRAGKGTRGPNRS